VANVKGFVSGVQDRFGMRPVVPFQTPLEIGDVGTIDRNGVWNPRSNTRDRFGLVPEGIRTSKANDVVWDLTSGSDVKFRVYALGQTSKLIQNVADAKLRTEIEFNSAKSFVFAARDVVVRAATQFDALITAIRAAYHNRDNLPEDRRWDANLAFVFAVADARRFVALLAERGSTVLSATGSGKLGPPADPSKLAAGVRFGAFSNELQKVNAANAQGSFYRAYALRPSVLKSWDNAPLEEVHFARSRWFGGGYRIAAYDIPASPAAIFGDAEGFSGYGGTGEVGYVIASALPTTFEESFVEV
jgi:hypothetical protein